MLLLGAIIRYLTGLSQEEVFPSLNRPTQKALRCLEGVAVIAALLIGVVPVRAQVKDARNLVDQFNIVEITKPTVVRSLESFIEKTTTYHHEIVSFFYLVSDEISGKRDGVGVTLSGINRPQRPVRSPSIAGSSRGVNRPGFAGGSNS
jgi:hypothetical protein